MIKLTTYEKLTAFIRFMLEISTGNAIFLLLSDLFAEKYWVFVSSEFSTYEEQVIHRLRLMRSVHNRIVDL